MLGVPGKSLWVVAAVKARFGWPTSRMCIQFRGREFLLRPETDELTPSICIRDEKGLTLREGHNLVNRFLSALAWSQGAGADVMSIVGSSGNEPICLGKGELRRIADPWHMVYLPQPTSEMALRALAVFREALSLENPAYRFLGLFKILNIRFSSGTDQKNWINQNLSALKDSRSLERLQQLAHEKDIGAYLYHQGRCAVAHAFASDVIDPDVSEDIRRLEDDGFLMQELAELLISKELDVPTDLEFWYSLRNSWTTPPECVTAVIEPDRSNNVVQPTPQTGAADHQR